MAQPQKYCSQRQILEGKIKLKEAHSMWLCKMILIAIISLTIFYELETGYKKDIHKCV